MFRRLLLLLLVGIAAAQAAVLFVFAGSEVDRAATRLNGVVVALASSEKRQYAPEHRAMLLKLAEADVDFLMRMPLWVFPKEVSIAFDTAKATLAEPRRRHLAEFGEVPAYVDPDIEGVYVAWSRELQAELERAELRSKRK